MLKTNIRKIGIASILMMALMMAAMFTPVSAAVKEETEVASASKVTETITIDGSLTEGVWSTAAWSGVARRQEATTLNNTADFATAWDDKNLYVAIKVVDDKIVTKNLNENIYNNDGVEIYIESTNAKQEKAYDDTTLHLMLQVADGEWTIMGGSEFWTDIRSKFPGVQIKHALTDNGYTVEATFPFADLGIENPWDGTMIGLEVTNNDDDDEGSNAATDRGVLYWNQNTAADDPSTWGSVCLYKKAVPVVSNFGTANIDGVISADEPWVFTSEQANAAGTVMKLASMCDVENLYIAVDLIGENLDGGLVSFFIDRDLERSEKLEEYINIYNYSLQDNKSDWTRAGAEGSFNYSPQVGMKAVKNDHGYTLEVKISLSEFNMKPEHLDALSMMVDFLSVRDDYTDTSRILWNNGTATSAWSGTLTHNTLILNNVNVGGGSNNAPSGNQIACYSIAQGMQLNGKVTVTDPDGDPLTFVFDPNNKQAGKSSGTFELNETTGEFTYTPSTEKFLAPDGVNYYIQVSDPSGASFHHRIEISVEPTPTNRTLHVNGDIGNDSNDGSAEKPWKTLYHAVNSVKPGDTVLVHESKIPYGYEEQRTITMKCSGLPGAYITFKAADGEKPVVNCGTVWNTVSVLGAYLKIEGLTFKGQGHEVVHNYEERYEAYRRTANGENVNSVPNAVKYQTNGVSIYPENSGRFNVAGIDNIKPMHHIEIRDCLIDGMTAAGLCVVLCDYVVVENNTIINNCWGNMYASSGISVLGNVDIDDNFGEHKIIVRNNITAGNRHFVPWISLRRFSDGNGIIIDSTNNASTNSDLLSKGDKWGALPYQGRILVANNLTYLNGGSGIHVFDGDYTDLINNTVYSNSSTPILGYSDFYASQANSINMYNNIVYSRTGAKMNISSSANSEVYYDNNLFYNYSASNNNLGKDIPGSRGKVGTVAGENNIYGKDPLFKNVYEVNHDKGEGYPASWTAEMKEYAKNAGYFVGANYSVTDLGYDFGLKEGSPALESGNKEWSDLIGNSENRLGIFGTVGSSLMPVVISDAKPNADIPRAEDPETVPMGDVKPEETKPAETKPAETKPTETDLANSDTLDTEADDNVTAPAESSNVVLYVVIGCVIAVVAIIAVLFGLKKKKAK